MRSIKRTGKVLEQKVSALEGLITKGRRPSDKAARAPPVNVTPRLSSAFSCATAGAQARFSADASVGQLATAAACAKVRQIAVWGDASLCSDVEQIAALGHKLDAFLAPHYAWAVVSEPYAASGSSKACRFLFQRKPKIEAEFVEKLQRAMHPAECGQHKIVVANDPYRFFGSLLQLWSGELLANAAADTIFVPYAYTLPSYNWIGVGNGFCPATLEKNKWLCYFLPISACQPPKDKPFVNCESSGNPTKECSEGYYTYAAGTRKQLRRDWSNSGNYYEPPRGAPTFKFPAGYEVPNDSLWPRTTALMLLKRFNYRARALLHARIRTFNEGNPGWDRRGACAAVHARRGDKLDALANLPAQDLRRRQKPGFSKSFGDYMAKASELLGKVSGAAGGKQTVFIMTDDPAWVEQNKKKHPDLDIFSIGGHGQPESAGQQKATNDAIDLFASLQLAARCSVMVGNFDSNISGLMFEYMCYHNKDKQCPLFHSFGNDKRWRALGR